MFEREIKLIGKNSFEHIQKATVCIIGLGGVGGHAVETLIRSGIKNIVIVDYDVVDVTNKNRQIIANDDTIGRKKTEEMKERILKINSDVNVIIIDRKLDVDNLDIIFNNKIDYLIDACDTVKVKKELIRQCINNKIKFISSMGTGNKLDPTKLEICDIRDTNYDPLARVIRKFVKDQKIKEKVTVVCSKEIPIKTTGDVSSIAYVPSVAGILCASYVINDLIKEVRDKNVSKNSM